MAPRRRGRRQRGRRRSRTLVERMTFSLQVGSSQQIKVSNLSSLPKNHNFRPVVMSVQVAGAYVPAQVNNVPSPNLAPGFTVPAAVQIELRSPYNDLVATSKPEVISYTGKTVSVGYPRSADWWSYNESPESVIGIINAICLGSVGTKSAAYLRGIISFHFNVGDEILSPTCPTMQHLEASGSDPI